MNAQLRTRTPDLFPDNLAGAKEIDYHTIADDIGPIHKAGQRVTVGIQYNRLNVCGAQVNTNSELTLKGAGSVIVDQAGSLLQ